MHTPNNPRQTTATIIAILIALSPIFIAGAQSAQITASQEYKQFVHTTINSNKSNTTTLDKPIFPVMINSTQIQIGQNWTITCPLQANHQYQIYCYGAWTKTQINAKTDYNIYVYDPSGSLVTSNTEAAGIIKIIHDSDNINLFTPSKTGNYTFIIKNDARASIDSQQATFMIMENIEENQWYTLPMQGKAADGSLNLKSTWAYEFSTNASQINIYIKVPANLDIYEARLFLMNDGTGPVVNSYPLAVESGLYGNVTGTNIGGYNFDTNGSRGVAFASSERMGEDIFLNYTSTSRSVKLYYLAFYGLEGQGNIDVMVKTNFDNITLTQAKTIAKVTPAQTANVTYQTSGASLEEANLTYSIDDWATSEYIPMTVNNRTCSAIVPTQKAGTTVQYQIDATDILENTLSTTGSYTVKNQPKLNITIAKNTVLIGQNITIKGILTQYDADSAIDVKFMAANDAAQVNCSVTANGTFTGSFGPQSAGDWSVLATSHETDTAWGCSSSQFLITVNEPPVYVKYSLYIVIGLVVACAVGGVVYFLKFRGK